jgi:hypothetical protein
MSCVAPAGEQGSCFSTATILARNRDTIGFWGACSFCSFLEYPHALPSLTAFDRRSLAPVTCPALMLRSEQGVRFAQAVSRRAGPMKIVMSMS